MHVHLYYERYALLSPLPLILPRKNLFQESSVLDGKMLCLHVL